MATIPDLEKHLTPELRAKRAQMLEQRGLPNLGFYEQLMAYPELFERLQALGTFVRFQSELPPRIREATVLLVARELESELEWQTHYHSALEAGVEVFTLETAPELEDVRETVRCVTGQRSVPQPLFDRLTTAYGLKGAVEIVTLASMYRMFASLGAAFDSKMPGGERPPWE
jgi:4-carboxymuconolactone decarboxylase